MTIGKNIAKLLALRGYSKEYLAVNTNTTVGAINSWLSEQRTPPVKTLVVIADFLGVSINDLTELPEDKIQNIANIKLDPQSQASIDRIQRMRDAGISEAKIDEFIDFAISMIQTKKAP
jgi:transcriptional regulator with XRE-family HTH domain